MIDAMVVALYCIVALNICRRVGWILYNDQKYKYTVDKTLGAVLMSLFLPIGILFCYYHHEKREFWKPPRHIKKEQELKLREQEVEISEGRLDKVLSELDELKKQIGIEA